MVDFKVFRDIFQLKYAKRHPNWESNPMTRLGYTFYLDAFSPFIVAKNL
jgi:hypothetical protein